MGYTTVSLSSVAFEPTSCSYRIPPLIAPFVCVRASCGVGSDLPPKTDLLHKGHSKGGKLLVVMVGLPGTGKTYISRKVARYLRWINYRTRAFSLAM